MALFEFYGTECPHCMKMMPVVDKLIAEGIQVEKLEVWHNKENAAKMQEYDKGNCGGVPYFMNTDSGEWICGETDESALRAWASGKKAT